MNLRDIILNVLRTRILPVVTRIRLFLSPNYIWARLSELFRVFLRNVLNIRPRDKDDYYPVSRWLVSKRLAFAAVIIVTLVCSIFIATQWSALFPGNQEAHIKTYNYNSILLKFAKGKVRIRGKSGWLAYEGEVSQAACNGEGTLFNPKGNVIYEGNFASSMYEGKGTRYYDDGTLYYTGEFHRNLFSGTGKLYRPTGSLEYEGSFSQGYKEGYGRLYSTGAEKIFEGDFSRDEILFSALIGKTSADMAVCYSGTRKLYTDGDERVRYMPDIQALTEEVYDTNSLDDAAKVSGVYVLKDYIPTGGEELRTFSDLSEAFGDTIYTGESYATLPEIIAINTLNAASDRDVLYGPVEVTETDIYTEYTEIDGYNSGYVVWLHSYEKDGLIYNFVSNEGDETFAFYFILQNDLSDES